MYRKKLTYLTACLLLSCELLTAQDKLDIKFGKIAAGDFDLSGHAFDTAAAAVIIADIGNTSFSGNGKGDFTMIFKRFKRVKILNRSGFDAATEIIRVYNDGMYGENLAELKASTFNLENGKITETKLDDKSVFTDKLDKYRANKKFTMPAVKEGSIVDISYTIKSDYYTYLRAWNFQGDYPCLWSEYEVKIPQFFHYVVLKQGDQNYFINTTKDVPEFYSVRESGGTSSDDIYNISTMATETRWVMKDVSPLKEESCTSSLMNYVSRLQFQLHYVQFTQSSERHDRMGNYYLASEKLLKDEDFGASLDNDNSWMNGEFNTIIAGCSSPFQKMQKIYAFVRDNFSCTSHEGIYIKNSLKSVFKSRSGNIAEINLLLTAMLRHANIESDPVILSTRDNGFTNDLYPMMTRFNYVVCCAKDNDKTYFLDAGWPKLSFGKLNEDCYNGGARLVNKDHPILYNLSPDSLKEAKVTTVFITNAEKAGDPMAGTFNSTLGNAESYSLRSKISKNSLTEYFANLRTYNADYNITNGGIDSLSQLDMPATVHYDFSYKIMADDDVIYFNPIIAEGYKGNPFKAADRKYPVEMSYVTDETYVLNMEIPLGYIVDELPKSTKVSLNGDDGSFEYLIAKDENSIQLRCRIKLNKATYEPEDYSSLRDFFGYIVKKQGEQIVFKKKK